MTAIHQIVYNAVMHRTYEETNAPTRVYWYNDRIEITSPGGPYGNVTPENFGKPGITDYVVIPLGADLFSLQGLKNLGPTLREWRVNWKMTRTVWQQ